MSCTPSCSVTSVPVFLDIRMKKKKVSKTNLFDDRDLKPEKTESPLDFLCKFCLKDIYNVELLAIFFNYLA